MNSSELRGYLTGLILGDGSIDKGVHKRAFEIKSINHDFIDQIYKDISSCTNFNCKINHQLEYYDQNHIHHKESWAFKIMAHPYFNKKYHYFYNDYRQRRIHMTALKWLTLRGLANWYMSDGYICLVGKTKGVIRDRRVDLCTDRYTKSDVEKIQKYLLEYWGWDTSIIQRKQNGRNIHRLRFKKTSAQDFLYKIHPYITPSFQYKLDMRYDHQPHWMTDEYYSLMIEIHKRESLNEVEKSTDEGEEIVYDGSTWRKNHYHPEEAAYSEALTYQNS